MTPTPYSEVYNRFLNKISDYFIKNQLILDRDFANEVLHDYLISSISKFTYSTKNLSQRDDIFNQFDIELSDIEKEILSLLMIVEYLSPKILNDEFLLDRIGSKDYTQWSPNNLLKELKGLRKNSIDEANLLMIEYYYRQGI